MFLTEKFQSKFYMLMYWMTNQDKYQQINTACLLEIKRNNIDGWTCVPSYICRKYKLLLLNWWKEKPSGSIACTRKQQPRFYWSCSSVVMNDATKLFTRLKEIVVWRRRPIYKITIASILMLVLVKKNYVRNSILIYLGMFVNKHSL